MYDNADMSGPLSRVGRLSEGSLTAGAVVAVPATTIILMLRRRARRKAGNQAWRYRTHHEASADSARIVSSNYQEGLQSAIPARGPGDNHRRAER
jgi:hypothetical protein